MSSLRIIRRSLLDAFAATQRMAANDSFTAKAARPADALAEEAPPTPPAGAVAVRMTPAQSVLIVLGVIGFLYFARPVILPIALACLAAMTLKPLIRWLSRYHIPPALSAAVVLCLLASAAGIGLVQLGRPAMAWMNEAPQHMAEL